MTLSGISLAITLLLWGLIGLAKIAVGMNVVYVLAIVTAVLLILEGLGAINVSFNRRNRTNA